MKTVGILFVLFTTVSLIEIYVFIVAGEFIGVGWTLFAIVLTAFIGAWLVRIQGILTFNRGLSVLSSGTLPAIELIEGLFLLVAAALLITPGFVTDAIGFLCLSPQLRRQFAKLLIPQLSRYFKNRTQKKKGQPNSPNSDTFETDFRNLNDAVSRKSKD